MLKKTKIINLLFIATLLFGQSSYSLNIIFDLGGVLIKHDTSYFIKKINIRAFIIYLALLNNPLSLKKRLFEALGNVPTTTNNKFSAGDDNGKKLPNIMCDWLSGEKTSTEIKTLTLKMLEDKKDFCKPGEKEVLCNVVELLFTPNNSRESNIISQEGLKFVKMCKKSGHKIFILSNWDRESAPIMTKNYPELFDLFDQNNIFFSGQIGLIKPDPKIYEYILTKNNLNPKECIFFDDQTINIKAANNAGIHGILCKNAKCTDMVKELNKFTKQVGTELLYPEKLALTQN